MTGARRGGLGFTVIEVLVAIAVIAVLLGITAPALVSVRRAAGASECRARLHTIGQFYALYAGQHRDEWPNLVPTPDSGPLDVGWGSAAYFVYAGGQIDSWAWPLRVYLPGEGPEYDGHSFTPARGASHLGSAVWAAIEILSCPFVEANRPSFRGSREYLNPLWVSGTSFLFSAALFTRADVWDEGDPAPDLNDATAIVHHSDVASPSRKAALVEAHTHHSARPWTKIEDAAAGAVNVLAADLHVEPVPVTAARPPALFTNRWDVDPVFRRGVAIPFVSTRGGYLGTDW